jgi:hypothetical protein
MGTLKTLRRAGMPETFPLADRKTPMVEAIIAVRT